MNIETHVTIILFFVVCGRETWSLSQSMGRSWMEGVLTTCCGEHWDLKGRE
jgi:hypothetical protein